MRLENRVNKDVKERILLNVSCFDRCRLDVNGEQRKKTDQLIMALSSIAHSGSVELGIISGKELNKNLRITQQVCVERSSMFISYRLLITADLYREPK